MNNFSDSPRIHADELERLHHAARIEAERLRREAIDDFWRGADALLSSAWVNARRSADRLAARLSRHSASRAAPCLK